jgi:hypothetical protein
MMPGLADLPRIPFRFDAQGHSYIELATGEELQHITGMTSG